MWCSLEKTWQSIGEVQINMMRSIDSTKSFLTGMAFNLVYNIFKYSLIIYSKSKSTVICPWGADGAAAQNADGVLFTAPVYKGHELVVDSLGAGDTFAAAVIHSLSRNFKDVSAAIEFGCLVAGHKVGYYGYDCVSAVHEKFIK